MHQHKSKNKQQNKPHGKKSKQEGGKQEHTVVSGHKSHELTKEERFNQQVQLWNQKKKELLSKKRGLSTSEGKTLSPETLAICESLRVQGSKKLVGLIQLSDSADLDQLVSTLKSSSNLTPYSDHMGLVQTPS